MPQPMRTKRCTAAAALRAPPPSHNTGRRARRKRSASASTWVSTGRGGVTASGNRSSGRSSSVACTSIGISMLTGPQGGVAASRAASRSVASAVCALRMRNAALLTDCSIASCAGASWMKPRSRSRYSASIWPVRCSIGVPAVSASTSAPAALPAPVPVLVTHTPSDPVTRAYASAMLQAPASPRAETNRILRRVLKASRIGMLWMEITPNAARVPHCSRKRTASSPTVIRVELEVMQSTSWLRHGLGASRSVLEPGFQTGACAAGPRRANG